MKLNPYVGWFRHSPDTSSSSVGSTTIAASWKKHQQAFYNSSRTSALALSSSSSLHVQKLAPLHASPYVGYFRHSPTAALFKAMEDELFTLFKAFLPSLKVSCVQELADFLAGRLRGGSPWWSENPAKEGGGNHSALLNARVLSRIVGWILAPLLGEKTTAAYKSLLVDSTSRTNREESLAAAFGSSDVEQEASVARSNAVDSNQEDDLDSSERDVEEAWHVDHASVPPPDTISRHAESLFAQQAARELNPDEAIPSRLDFVITQLDIIRMQRNASRHLDVQSIYQLPTVTYLKHQRTSTGCIKASEGSGRQNTTGVKDTQVPDQSTRPAEEGWSWMLVAEHDESTLSPPLENSTQDDPSVCCPGQRNLAKEQQHPVEDVCVICLEPFAYGDRLRVLPCGHSFHMGCIDRWLSGSASFDECHTAGCPMCKKRPTVVQETDAAEDQEQQQHLFYEHDGEEEEREGELRPDGSVPSWAFSQLGSALLERDAQQIRYCSNA